MQIQVQPTPNPNAMKFVLQGVHFAHPLSFPSAAAATAHPLAAALFALDGVYNVFMVQDFVTVNKRPEAPWDALVGPIEELILNYLSHDAIEEKSAA